VRASLTSVLVLTAASVIGCRSNSSKLDRMHEPSIETIVHIPWGPEPRHLLLSLEPFPNRGGDVGVVGEELRQAPEMPLLRVDEQDRVAVLNEYRRGVMPSGTLRWFFRGPGDTGTHVRTAAHPFAGEDGSTLAVDFLVRDRGALVLLEKVFNGDDSTSSRLAVISAEGRLVLKNNRLDGGPYTRIVPDDRGRVFLLSELEKGVTGLNQLDLTTGMVDPLVVALAPGTRASVAANHGSVIVATRHLEKQGPERLARPTTMHTAVGSTIGADEEDNYYTFLHPDDIFAISFGGELLGRIAVSNFPEIAPTSDWGVASASGARGVVPRIGASPTWQVDRHGRVYVPKVDAEGFSVLRMSRINNEP
jgi:hypothetical protein